LLRPSPLDHHQNRWIGRFKILGVLQDRQRAFVVTPAKQDFAEKEESLCVRAVSFYHSEEM